MADSEDMCVCKEDSPTRQTECAAGRDQIRISPKPEQSLDCARGDEGCSDQRHRLEDEGDRTALWDKRQSEEVVEDADASDSTEDDEAVDPRIEVNLEILNQSCTEINRLENELDEARKKYRSTFQMASQRLEELGGKMPKTVQRARQYFELAQKAKEAQSEALRATRLYQSANGQHRAAKEMLTLAEKGLENSSSNTHSLNSAWQETLSHAIEKVMEAAKEKTRKEMEHNKRAAICTQLESQIHILEKKFKRSIAKARPYFEARAELELKLSQLKQNILDLQQTITIRKGSYTNALRNLEVVSMEIHESRRSREKLLLQFPREPGVGAETDSMGSSISDANLDRCVFSSAASFGDEDIEESDDEVEVSEDSGTSSMSQSPNGTYAVKHCKGEAVDSRSVNSDASVTVFSRSVSDISVFSSEGQCDSAPQSPCAATVPAMPTVQCSPLAKGGSVSVTSPTHCPQRLLDLAQGDVGSRHVAGDDHSAGMSPGDRCGDAGADLADTRNAPGEAEGAKNLQKDSQFSTATLPTPDCQREDGDGSAQEEECPREVDSTNAHTSVCSQFSANLSHNSQYGATGDLQSSNLQGKIAAPTQRDGTDMTVKTVSGMSHPASPKLVTEGVKKTPLHRTDATKRRSLQGLMLNPSDLFRLGHKH